eukprot:CAMPEP_0201657578 /NCGR_PEP_ID=MMETSP0494-20130426/777_1 /ASSEMBLY_ACC=CAM_ASM_000839 /TAXON_ID=420259 /ORGANISM="Thalassiosira gravida, Strain GMp14c1" /LENGTH=511 /DNA_ID=CAMNT_0048134445 /DNA_START=260 /DNA_END=1795 /DNA_ORIENTATION=+
MVLHPQRQSHPAQVAVVLLSQVVLLCAPIALAFAPTSLFQLVAPAGTSLNAQPYFADFAATKVNAEPKRIIDSIPPIHINNINNNNSNEDEDDRVGVGKTAVIAGSTGYIGRACVRECVARGYNTIALVRDVGRASSDGALDGASLVECDVTDGMEVQQILEEIALGSHNSLEQQRQQQQQQQQQQARGKGVEMSATRSLPLDMIVSCLASPSGIESEVYAVDYRASLNLLNAARESSVAARHYVLLSAFCCRNPILKLQQAKLQFEDELTAQNDMTYSIVRPTAFFKSVSGQLESILEGNSYVLFGDGAVTQCNPIAEEELAMYMCDSALEEYRDERWGKILNVGGPDAPLSNKMLGEMMFKAINKPSKFVYVPTQVFDISISMIECIAKTWPSQKWEDVLETSKIGKYYAVEDMLTIEEEEKFGKITMMDHFEKIANEGQDPFTPVRATAVISKTLEALPAVSISVPLGWGLLSNTNLLENVMTTTSSNPLAATVPMLVSSLTDNNFIS